MSMGAARTFRRLRSLGSKNDQALEYVQRLAAKPSASSAGPTPAAAEISRAATSRHIELTSTTLFPRQPPMFCLTPYHAELLKLPKIFLDALPEIERGIGVTFKNKLVLAQALMHSSYVNTVLSSKEAGSVAGDTSRTSLLSNRWLAMMGDSVLNMVVTLNVAQTSTGLASWENFTPKSHEMRSNQLFSQVAAELNVTPTILRGPGVAEASQTMAATALEALVGAVCIDQGLTKSILVIESAILPRLQKYRTK